MIGTGRRRRLVFAAIFALPLSFCLVAGYQLETAMHVTPGITGVTFFLLLSVALTLLTSLSFRLTLTPPAAGTGVTETSQIEDNAVNPGRRTTTDHPGGRRICIRSFLITWTCIAIPNLIVLLGVYPGFFVYDAQDELMEVVTRSFNTHHPLLHVLAMGGTITGIHKFTDSWNTGIFIYLFAQMLFITAVFALVLTRLRFLCLSRRLTILFTLWYGFFPTVVMYTLCSTKDGPFSAFATLFVLALWELFSEKSDNACSQTGDSFCRQESVGTTAGPPEKRSAPRRILLTCLRPAVPALLMMLLRNNACYALAVFVLILLLMLLWEKLREKRPAGDVRNADPGASEKTHKRELISRGSKTGKTAYEIVITSVIISILLYLPCSRLLISVTHASHDEHQETISVAIQSLGRVWVFHPEVFTEEDRTVLLTYLDEAALDHYDPHNVDLLKATFNNSRYGEDPASFWRLWLKAARQVPATILNSWFLTSYGLWYPFAVNNVYEGHEVFTFTYTESSYFGYETELPGVRRSLIPPIDRLYRWLSLDATIQRIPVLSLLFAPAFYFWLYAWFAVRMLAQKKGRALLPFIPLFLLWLTYLIGPYWLIRYMLPFFTSLPVMLTAAAGSGQKQ